MTSSSERRFRALALVVALATAAPALAVPAFAAPSAEDLESARALRKEAKKLRAAKDFTGALEKFKAAYALVPTAVTGYELATAFVDAHKLVEARSQAITVVEMPKEPDETDVSATARAEAKKLAADLAPRIPTLRVKVMNPPANATLAIDDQTVAIEVAAAGRKVNPGRHVAVATAAGLAPARAEIDLAEGEDKELVVTFATAVAPSSPPPVSETPPPPQPVPIAPPHVEPPAPPPRAELPAPSHGTSSLVWVGLGIGGPALVVGTITGAIALSKASEVKGQCSGNVCPRSVQSSYDKAQSLALVSTISFAVALGGAALSIIGLVSGDSPSPSRGAIRPAIGFGFVGVDGRF